MRALVVANPVAGGSTPELIDAVRRRCAKRVREVAIAWTDRPDAGVTLVERAVVEARAAGTPLDLVIAVGGDGTVREVAEGIARAGGAWPHGGTGEMPALLALPSGTGNSVYRALWGECAWEQTLDRALTSGHSQLRVLDLARVIEDDRATVLGYNAGLLGRIAQLLQANRGDAIEQRYEAAIGQAVEELAAYPQRVTVDDDVLYEGPTMMTTVGGLGRFGRGAFEVLPRSRVDDGLLDVCVIGEVARERFGEFAALLGTGQHVGRREVAYAQGARVKVERLDGEALVSEYDGDPRRAGSVATIDVVPRAVGALAALDPP